MMLRAILSILLLVIFLPGAHSSEILNLIKNGRLDQARAKMAERTTAARRDGNLLYFQALLEPNGETSYEFLEAAFKADISPEYLEDNVFLMIQYYRAENDYDKLATTTDAYLQYWENGRYRAPVLRLSALAAERRNMKEEAAGLRKKIMRENEENKYGQVGLLDEAVSLYNKKQYISAQRLCRSLRKKSYHDVVVPALYMLSYYSIEQKRIDDAILYYNILNERYPDAVGLNDLAGKLGSINRTINDNQAEVLTGTIYSIQVGVFSIEKNARETASRFKKFGKQVDIRDKIISGKKYYVVYVGRFTSSDKALSFKNQLEQSENEAFHVVAR
jgi:tetratricopeptide (TPR) repeat protein